MKCEICADSKWVCGYGGECPYKGKMGGLTCTGLAPCDYDKPCECAKPRTCNEEHRGWVVQDEPVKSWHCKNCGKDMPDEHFGGTQ